MLRSCFCILVLGTSSLSAQSPIDLLQRVADHFNNASTFVVKGTASAAVPGTSWRASYEFETQGAQPAFLPLSFHGPSMRVISRVGKLSQTLAVPGATDPKPQRGFAMVPLGQYNTLTRRLTDAQKTGTENITFEGKTHSCEVIDAVYDTSPEFKPHSTSAHKRVWVDPSDLLVLRESQSTPDGLEWTAEVTSISFDQPPSETMVQALQAFAAQAKDRPDWVGRAVPDLTLTQLSGARVRLAELQGKPVLLDFWGSYCGTCKRTTLYAQELAKRYQSSALAVLTLTQDTAADARLWVDYNHVTLPVLLDTDGAAFKAFEIQGVPVTILIGADGKVVHYWVGLDDPASMEPVVQANLKTHAVPAAEGSERH